MRFDDSFFETEVRDGFEVPSIMKHAWAAQIELMEEIREICDRHGIRFFADYGTLLGTVRHKGYIPWDDDLDIGMLRADLRHFLEVAQYELPQNCHILNMHTNSNYRDTMTRVINADHVSLEPSHMQKYHDCPFVVGVDIFPYDYVTRDKEELESVVTILGAIGEVMKIVWGTVDDSVKGDAVKQIEMLCGVNFDWGKPIDRQLMDLYENLTTMYTEEESDRVGIYTSMVRKKSIDYCFDKEWFSSFIEMPFENTTIPVPVGYDALLKRRFGDYMTPRITFAHGYPFYKSQMDEIRDNILKEPERADQWKKYLI